MAEPARPPAELGGRPCLAGCAALGRAGDRAQARGRLAWRLGWALALGLLLARPAPASAIELCSEEGRELMRSVDIPQAKIDAVCEQAARASAPLTLRVRSTRDEQGYCRVTLALINNSTLYLNALVLTVEEARFPPFEFRNITPGGTGYASENSRILLACNELQTEKLAFRWPASLRLGDRVPTGRQLLHYRPYLLDPRLAWSP